MLIVSAFSIGRLAISLVAVRDSGEELTVQAISSCEVDSLESYLYLRLLASTLN